MKNYQRGFNLNAVWFLIGANIILYVATYINPELRYNLGFYPARFREEPWTIVTSLFVHAGIYHVFFNMMTLYFFGTNLYRLIGENKFLILYFLGGITGNVFFMFLGDQYSIIIGASGAVFAVGGALVVLLPKLKAMVFPVPVPLPLWIVLGGTFFLTSLFPNVAWQAHLGGLLFGLASGYLFKKKLRYLP